MTIDLNSATGSKPTLLTRLVNLIIVALMVVGILILLLWIARMAFTWLIVPSYVQDYMQELVTVSGLSRDLGWPVILVAVFGVSYLVESAVRLRSKNRGLILIVLIACFAAYWGLHAWYTRNDLFDREGKPLFYWGLNPDGTTHRQTTPGLNRITAQPLRPASQEYLILRGRETEPFISVDAATNDWFGITGQPLLWWSARPDGKLDFFRRSGVDPRYGSQPQPVTLPIRKQWEQEQTKLKAEAEARAARDALVQREAQARRAAEQQRLFEIEHSRAEAARYENETAAACARDERMHREAEQKAAEAEQQARRDAAENARREAEAKILEAKRVATSSIPAAQPAWQSTPPADAASRRQMVLDRRAREATAPATSLAWLEPCEVISRIRPNVNPPIFHSDVFSDGYQFRRFRFVGTTLRFQQSTRQITFAVTTCESAHCQVVATLTPEASFHFAMGGELRLCATVADIKLGGAAHSNGQWAPLWTIFLCNATSAEPQSAAEAQPIHEAAMSLANPAPFAIESMAVPGGLPPVVSAPVQQSASFVYIAPPRAVSFAAPAPPVVVYTTRPYASPRTYCPQSNYPPTRPFYTYRPVYQHQSGGASRPAGGGRFSGGGYRR